MHAARAPLFDASVRKFVPKSPAAPWRVLFQANCHASTTITHAKEALLHVRVCMALLPRSIAFKV
jgi:hypothetical protein